MSTNKQSIGAVFHEMAQYFEKYHLPSIPEKQAQKTTDKYGAV